MMVHGSLDHNNDDEGHAEHPDCGAKWDGEFACLNLEGQAFPLAMLVTALVFFALVAESVIHRAVHVASSDRFWRNFVAAMLAELSMLGLISFTLFGVSQSTSLSEDSVLLIEFVHLTIFLMMIIYYSLIGILALATKKVLTQLRENEKDLPKFNLVACISDLRQIQEKREARWWFILFPFGCNGELEKKMFKSIYMLTRHYFLVSQGLPTDLPFDFAEYTDRCTSALCVKMVQVGWRMWTFLLTFVILSGSISYYFDFVNDTRSDSKDIWLKHVTDNSNYFWSLFIIVWTLFVFNGIIWARVERSRAKLVLLSAKREMENENQANDAGGVDHEGDFETRNTTEKRSTVYSEKNNIDAIGTPVSIMKSPSGKSPLASNHKINFSHGQSRHGSSHHGSSHHGGSTIGHTSHQTHASSQQHHHDDELEKTERTIKETLCPHFAEVDAWRKCFPLVAPELPLRTFQAVLMFFSLFLALSLLIFLHIDPLYFEFAILQPFAYIYFFGLQQLPYYATLRFFGPSLAKNSLVDDLIWDAQELQWEELQRRRYGEGGDDEHDHENENDGEGAKKNDGGCGEEEDFQTEPSLAIRPTQLVIGEDSDRMTAASGSTARGGVSTLEEPLLRNWEGGEERRRAAMSPVDVGTRRVKSPKREIDDHDQLGDLLRGWGGGEENQHRAAHRNSLGGGFFGGGRNTIGGANYRNSLGRNSLRNVPRNSFRPTSVFRPSMTSYVTNRGTIGRVSFSNVSENDMSMASGRCSRSSVTLVDALRVSGLRSSTGNSLIDISDGGDGAGAGTWRESKGEKVNIKKSKSESMLFTPKTDARLDRIISDESHHPKNIYDGVDSANESIYISRENLKSIYMIGEHGKKRKENYLSMDNNVDIYNSRAMLEDIFKLLNGMGTGLFVRLALFRVVVFVLFVVLLIFTNCRVNPVNSMGVPHPQCIWLDVV